MKTKILRLCLFIFSAIILFHFSVILGFIDFKIVWGGRLETTEQMYIFESISILINCFCIYLLLIQSGYMHSQMKPKLQRFILLTLAILFALNTLGNLASLNSLETKIFTPVTFILSFCFFYLAKTTQIERKNKLDLKA